MSVYFWQVCCGQRQSLYAKRVELCTDRRKEMCIHLRSSSTKSTAKKVLLERRTSLQKVCTNINTLSILATCVLVLLQR